MTTAFFPIQSSVGIRPFTLNTADPCISTFGMFGRDAEGRAKRLLEANLSRILANELWTGTRSVAAAFQAAGPPIINDSLVRNPTTLNGGVKAGYLTALAELEQAYADRDNRPGFIHCQPRIASLWKAAYAIELAPSGRYFTTGLGNVVVADAGYDGSGSGGITAGSRVRSWAYISGPVAYARTPVRLQTALLSERFGASAGGSAVGTNDLTTRAECDAAVFWDSKVNVACLVDPLVEYS